MNQKVKKNYYELLGITPGASRHDIEEAYRRAGGIYGADSVAGYSLYSSEERAAMLEQVTEAYDTLNDPLKKRTYDNQIAVSHQDGTREVDISALMAGPETFEEPHEASKLAGRQVVRLKRPLVVMDSMDSMVAEQYSILYTRIEQISVKNSYKTFAITSAVKGEGKSITSLNLSYVMASGFNKKTLMIECDLRKQSSLLNFMDKSDMAGLAEVLRGETDVHSAIRKIDNTSLYILPAGTNTKKSSELLSSQRFKAVLNTLKSEFDYVIVDSPPILPLVDMSIISKQVDGIIVVVKAGNTPKDLVIKAVNSLSGANVVGIVLNNADMTLKKYYY